MRYRRVVPRIDRRPRRRLDAESRRADILRAAGTAFTSQPYDRVSVAAIAAAADASEALVHRYFAGKSGLYLAVVRAGIQLLLDRQEAYLAELGPAAGPRRRLAGTIEVYLDAVAAWSVGWLGPLQSPGGEPAAALAVRRQSRETYAERLRDLLALPADPDLDYALRGYLGFLDAACVHWAERGYPPEARAALTDQAIAALAAALTAAGAEPPW